MGLCMQQASGQSFYHPSLGHLQKISLNAVSYLKTTWNMDNQECYICWVKKMNKLRSLPEMNEVLYLLVKQLWRGCSNALSEGQLQLLFQPYEVTLYQMVMSHKMKQTQLQEGLLWEVCYCILRYLDLCRQTEIEKNTLSFQNIVLDHQGAVKVITQPMIAFAYTPVKYKNKQLFIQIKKQNSQLPPLFCLKNLNVVLEVAGTICLSAAALLDVSSLSENNHLSWKNISEKVKKEALQKCRERYSSQLTQVLTDMISSAKRDNLDQIINKIEISMPQVQLGIYGPFKDKTAEYSTLLIPCKLSRQDQLYSVSDCHQNIDLKSTLETIKYKESEIQQHLEYNFTIL